MSPNHLAKLLSTPSTILVLDGGVSTHLENLTHKPFPDRHLWSSSLLLSIQGQNQIEQAHTDFLNAGCNILSTVTYQLSHFAEKYGYSKKLIDNLLNVAVDRAIEAIQNVDKKQGIAFSGKRFIFSSIGCYGSALVNGSEYTGNYSLSKEALMDFHREKFNLFRSNNHVNGILFETIPSKIEVEAILQLLVAHEQQCPSAAYDDRTNDLVICLSLACQNGCTLNDGTPLTTILDMILHVDHIKDENSRLIHCIGVNCCKIQYIYSLSKTIAEHILKSKVRRAIALYPNSGEEWDAQNNCWKAGSGCSDSKAFANELLKCIQMIHDLCKEYDQPYLPIIVGGCCRTSPDTISALREAVDKYNSDVSIRD